jgi:flavin reductase (DIM6/NTAB) family NADH-FMN oxidoreductase RutF
MALPTPPCERVAAAGRPAAGAYVPVPRHLLTRPLFINPVCCLISENAPGSANVMTVSWLTPIDNHALFLLSLNAKRHTLANLRARPSFVLCPYVEGMEPLALACGASSGAEPGGGGGKLAALGARLCAVGGGSAGVAGAPALPALADSPAHLRCRVLGPTALPPAGAGGDGGSGDDGGLRGHVALVCQVEEAYVLAPYWAEGKLFVAPSGAPRPLAFLGSQRFVAVGNF